MFIIKYLNIFLFLDLEREPLPNEIPAVEQLIADHKEFMENTARRQPEVDRACKPKAPPAGTKEPAARKPSRQLKTPVYVHLILIFFAFIYVYPLHLCVFQCRTIPNLYTLERTQSRYYPSFRIPNLLQFLALNLLHVRF